MMAVMVMVYTTVLSTKMKNADGWSGHGGGEAEGQWIKLRQKMISRSETDKFSESSKFGPITTSPRRQVLTAGSSSLLF